MILVLSKTDNQISESIFIEPYDEYLAKWVGGRMLAEEVEKISEIKNVNELDSFDSVMSSFFNRNRKNSDFTLYFDFYQFVAGLDSSLVARRSFYRRDYIDVGRVVGA